MTLVVAVFTKRATLSTLYSGVLNMREVTKI